MPVLRFVHCAIGSSSKTITAAVTSFVKLPCVAKRGTALHMICRSGMKAKQHFFLDVPITDVLDPLPQDSGQHSVGTKVLITLGPACHDVNTLAQMLDAGVTCARVDLTWGTLEYHRQSLANLNAAMQRTRRLCSVWLDTTGREMVVRRQVEYDQEGWPTHLGRVTAKRGQAITITTNPAAQPSESVYPINYPSIPASVQPGALLQVGQYLSTGAEGASLFLKVKSKTEDSLECEAQNDACMEGLLSVLICHRRETEACFADMELPLLTQHDVNCIQTFGNAHTPWPLHPHPPAASPQLLTPSPQSRKKAALPGAPCWHTSHAQHIHAPVTAAWFEVVGGVGCVPPLQEFEVDFIGLSYCNSAGDVFECRSLLDSLGMSQTKIVAKIERKAALQRFGEVMAAADGIIFSRGNLGLDFDAEQMAMLQKRAVRLCNAMGKPVILTRIVDTMVTAPRPTRAEATDVANAVLDGADGLMLGAETLRGLHPLLTVETVLRVAHCAEKHFDFRSHHDDMAGESSDFAYGGSPNQSYEDLLKFSSDSFGHLGGSPTYATINPGGGGGGGLAAGRPHLDSPPDSPRGLAQGYQGSPQDGSPQIPATNGLVAKENGPKSPKSPTLPPRAPKYASSFGNLQLANVALGVTAMAAAAGGCGGAGTKSMLGSSAAMSVAAAGRGGVGGGLRQRVRCPALNRVQRLESMALSATRTAEKINAGLIVVMSQSGRTASLVAKYRPPMPILAVVVPTLKSNGLGWHMEGKFLARQCLVIRGVTPMLAAPMTEGSDDLLSEALFMAAHQRMAQPNDYVVCILSLRGALAVKVVQINSDGTGLRVMHEHANRLVAGDDPDLLGAGHPAEASAFVACPGAATPRVGSPHDSPFARGLSFRGGAPPAIATGRASPGGGSFKRGGPLVPASPYTRPLSDGKEPGFPASPPALTLDPGRSWSQTGEGRPPSAGGTLPVLGRMSSNLGKPPTSPNLPPLPTSPPVAATHPHGGGAEGGRGREE